MVCDGVMNVLEVSVYIKHKADLHTKADTDPVDLIFVKSITNDLLIFFFFFFLERKNKEFITSAMPTCQVCTGPSGE